MNFIKFIPEGSEFEPLWLIKIAIKQHEEKKPPNSLKTKLGENFIQKVGKEIIDQAENEDYKAAKITKKNQEMHMWDKSIKIWKKDKEIIDKECSLEWIMTTDSGQKLL